jgi:hypothetical protein
MIPDAHSAEERPHLDGPAREEASVEQPHTDSPSRAEEQPSIDHRRERIRIETERHRIEGLLTLARDGYRSRVSDALNASERDFLTLTDVKVEPLEGGPAELHSYLTLARRHIVFAVSAEEDSG